ncbi:MAG: class I SAM-dependent methyltransferase [Coriobacteriales bacterium]|nr:class I SAM-dependent methyltransferase [Coriobacteriales bacterium]
MTKHILTTTDWNEEWMSVLRSEEIEGRNDIWDKRAAKFTKQTKPSDYITTIIEKIALLPGESVFDMGCGAGATSIPIAAAGHKICACDFSQGMLDVLNESASAEAKANLTTKLMSWEDNWQTFGIEPKSFDVAISSRSLMCSNIKAGIEKLNTVARRRVYITLPVTVPYTEMNDDDTKPAQVAEESSFQYAINILLHEGYFPHVDYIDGHKLWGLLWWNPEKGKWD